MQRIVILRYLESYETLTKCVKDMRIADIKSFNSLDKKFTYEGSPGIYKEISFCRE